MIKVGIVGYGNLGKGVQLAIKQTNDMELVAIFTRRNPESLEVMDNVPVVAMDAIMDWKEKVDVLVLCGGSATDLPTQTPELAKNFNVIDSFDTHANIPEHFANVDNAAKEGKTLAMISVGWDPGLFSLMRLYSQAILPQGSDYTFWGKGVSQGHSDAIRRIPGVKNAKQYTIPKEDALSAVRSGSEPELTVRDKHLRECFVVLEEGADEKAIEETIVTMPNYFDQYDTIVHFIDEDEFFANHGGMQHGGFVIRSGKTGENNTNIMEFSLQLDSNPEFTSSVLVAYVRAISRLASEGQCGCRTVFDIAPKYLIEASEEDIRAHLL